MDKSLNIALIGASGVVGTKNFKNFLEKKEIHFENLFPLGNSTVGNSIHFQNRDFIIGDIDFFDPKKANIVNFFQLGQQLLLNTQKHLLIQVVMS